MSTIKIALLILVSLYTPSCSKSLDIEQGDRFVLSEVFPDSHQDRIIERLTVVEIGNDYAWIKYEGYDNGFLLYGIVKVDHTENFCMLIEPYSMFGEPKIERRILL